MLTRGIEVTRYIRASAGRAGLNVSFEDTNMPRHDGKTIYLPRIVASTTERELMHLMASVDHEVAHDRYSSFDVLREKALSPKSLLMLVWNLLEDSRINNIEAKEYMGFRENWDDTCAELIHRILSRPVVGGDPLDTLVKSLIHWDTVVSINNFPICEAVASSCFTPDAAMKTKLDKFSDMLRKCHTILDKRVGITATYDLAKEILTEMGYEDQIKKEEEAGKARKMAREGSGSIDGEGGGGSDEEDSDGDPAEIEAGDAESKAKSDKYEIVTIEVTEADLKKYALTAPDHGSEMSKMGTNHEPAAIDRGVWDLTDPELFDIVDYPRNTGDVRCLAHDGSVTGFILEYRKIQDDKTITVDGFAQQVRRLVQIRAKVQRVYGVKKGKLDQSRLSRICFDAPGFNERVFKNTVVNNTLDAALSILVDMSGSMMGKKAYYALYSTLLMSNVCHTLGIPLEIVGFSDQFSSTAHQVVPLMFIYKSFKDSNISPDDITASFAKSSRFMNGNPDGENILWAYDRLLKRKERRRVLLVMSDGAPAASKSSVGLEKFTQRVIGEIESAKKVDIFGLGICSTSVRHYYHAHDVVESIDTLPTRLLNLFEQRILK